MSFDPVPTTTNSNGSEKEITSVLNPEVIDSLEKNAKACAANLSQLMENMKNNLKQITSLSVQNMEVYKQSVDSCGDAVGTSVIATNNLLTKCQELHDDLKPLEQLSNQIRDIKKTLELYEILVSRMTK